MVLGLLCLRLQLQGQVVQLRQLSVGLQTRGEQRLGARSVDLLGGTHLCLAFLAFGGALRSKGAW